MCEVEDRKVSACDVEGGLSGQPWAGTSCICNLEGRQWYTETGKEPGTHSGAGLGAPERLASSASSRAMISSTAVSAPV